MNSVPETDYYVLDGGSLLHCLRWETGDSYGAIAESYVDFTVRHYSQATVVFDGYGEGPSIKDNTYQEKNMHPIVSFTPETEFSCKKDDILSRDENKADMIALISTGDADVDIVKATLNIPSLHHNVCWRGYRFANPAATLFQNRQ